MQKFNNIIPFEPDNTTKAVVKEIQTTAGNFYSRICAYNQTLRVRENRIYANTRLNIGGPPIYIHSVKFRLNDDRLYQNIRDLTVSRINKTELYKIRYGIIKKIIDENPNNVVLFNFPFFEKEWEELRKEDIVTIIKLQIDAGIIYITVPISPIFSTETNVELINYANDNKKNFQEIVPCMHTKQLYNTFIELLSNILVKTDITCLMVSCRAILSEESTAIFSYLDNNFPKSKLLIGVDVPDSSKSEKKRLCFHHILRAFGFDITCRYVDFPLIEYEYKPIEEKRLYHDKTGAFFNEKEQKDWDGISFTDYVVNNFPAQCDLSIEEFFICLSFNKLNKTGMEEVKSIIDKKHIEYINKRIHLKAFWMSEKSLPDSEE